MIFNYNKLRGKIVEKTRTNKEFAERMNMSERTLSLKLNGERAWKQPEIVKAISLLGLTPEDIQPYFFDLEVQTIEQAS